MYQLELENLLIKYHIIYTNEMQAIDLHTKCTKGTQERLHPNRPVV